MERVVVVFSPEDLKALEQVPPPAIRRAMRKAGGDAIRAMRAEGKRHIRDRKWIKAGQIAKGLALRLPRSFSSDMEFRLDVSGKAFPLAAYPHRQTKKGVSVKVNRSAGSRTLILGAFVATMRSGHAGIFMRKGNKRLPIEELFSTRLVDAFQDAGFIPGVQHRGVSVFRAAFKRLLPLEIERLQGRKA